MNEVKLMEWHIWHSSLAGYDIHNVYTGTKRTKIDVYNQFKHNSAELELISLRSHSLFNYVPNGNGPFFTNNKSK